MKVLVLWYKADPPSTSIVEKEDIKYINDSTVAKWGTKYYEAKIIAENDDEEWLESLNVSTEGNIVKSVDNSSAALAMRCQAAEQKKVNRLKKKAAETANNLVIKERPVFEESEDDERDEGDLINELAAGESDGDEQDSENVDSGEPSIVVGSQIKVARDPENNKQDSKSRNTKHEFMACHFCDDFSEDATYEEKFVALAESAIRHLQNLKEEHKICPSSSNEIILSSGYEVKIDRHKLKDFLRFSKGDRKAITRYILLELIGEEKLSKMSATTIPQEIFAATERYVNSLRLRGGKSLTLAEFKRCITNYCGSLKVKLQSKPKVTESSELNGINIEKSKSISSNKTLPQLVNKAKSKEIEKNDIENSVEENVNSQENTPKIVSVEILPKIKHVKKLDEYRKTDTVDKCSLKKSIFSCENFDVTNGFSKLLKNSDLVKTNGLKYNEENEIESEKERERRKKPDEHRKTDIVEKYPLKKSLLYENFEVNDDFPKLLEKSDPVESNILKYNKIDDETEKKGTGKKKETQ